ncbi:hypothetical protein C8Q79DRAFT_689894 [Trametes meyenii]|nr:hypothetical protein C8Q79DRAFT_689894 [Trametes meyenii]
MERGSHAKKAGCARVRLSGRARQGWAGLRLRGGASPLPGPEARSGGCGVRRSRTLRLRTATGRGLCSAAIPLGTSDLSNRFGGSRWMVSLSKGLSMIIWVRSTSMTSWRSELPGPLNAEREVPDAVVGGVTLEGAAIRILLHLRLRWVWCTTKPGLCCHRELRPATSSSSWILAKQNSKTDETGSGHTRGRPFRFDKHT